MLSAVKLPSVTFSHVPRGCEDIHSHLFLWNYLRGIWGWLRRPLNVWKNLYKREIRCVSYFQLLYGVSEVYAEKRVELPSTR